MSSKVFYDVIPRYSGGSPGMVDYATAERVAQQEIESQKAYLEGAYGEDKKLWAEQQGLEGIVLSGILVAGDRNQYHDHITKRDYGSDMPYAAIRYPDRILAVRAKRSETFWYKRQFLIRVEGVVGDRDENFSRVMVALESVHGVDRHSEQPYILWREREIRQK